MRRFADVTAVVRAGRRTSRGTVVVHHLSSLSADIRPALVGLVVGRSVGGSVIRHRVSRRLRAQLAPRLSALPARSGTVVRALPDAATATSQRLGSDLDAALERVVNVVRT